MRLHVLSDLHFESDMSSAEAIGAAAPEADVVVLAGDIHNSTRGLEIAAQMWPDTPVVYVLGNHEYYGRRDFHRTLAAARERAAQLGIHLLENDEVRILGVRFLGCTLWSGLDSATAPWLEAAAAVEQNLSDFSEIRDGDKPFTALAMTQHHWESRVWLESMLDPTTPAVVVTHFAPFLTGFNPWFGGGERLLTAYFHNDLSHLAGPAAPLWIHGHHHHSYDEIYDTPQGATRVMSNQLGYPDESTGFSPGLIVEVP